MRVRACTTPFSAGTCTSNAHGKTGQHSQSAVLHVVTLRFCYFCNALCILHCICATCVCVWRLQATFRHGVTTVRYTVQ